MIRPSVALLVGAALISLIAACSSGGGAAPGLAGSSWTVVTIAGIDAVGTQPTMAFATDGSVSGTTGCNQYNGTYTTDGQTIKIGPLAMTRMACLEEAVNAQEVAFTAALEGATTWAIDSDGDLELRGQTVIAAEPAAE